MKLQSALVLGAILCLPALTRAQEGSYPPPSGHSSWEKPIQHYWEHLPGHNAGACAAGPTQPPQSPIDIRVDMSKTYTSTVSHPPIFIQYQGLPGATLSDAGHGHGWRYLPNHYDPHPMKITIGTTDYRLLQFHFHHPSEHLVNGVRKAMELHLVHQAADGKRAVIAVLLEEDPALDNLPTDNEMLWRALQAYGQMEPYMSSNPGFPHGNLEAMLPPPSKRRYITYTGSLTTPGCDGGVRWIVFATPVKIRPRDILSFKTKVQLNARWPQPLKDRQVEWKQSLEY